MSNDQTKPADCQMPTDEEMAAALAAVYAFIDSEGGLEGAKKPINSWRQASYLEGTGNAFTIKFPVEKHNLWKLAQSMVLMLIFELVLSQPGALSQELRGPIILPGQELPVYSEPPVAPQLPPAYQPQIAPQFVPQPTQQLIQQPIQQSVEPQIMRVGLLLSSDKLNLETPDGADIIDQQTGDLVSSADPQTKLSVTARRGTIAFGPTFGRLAKTQNPIRRVSFTPNPGSFDVADKSWSGLLLPFSTSTTPAPQSTGLPGQAGYLISPKGPDSLIGLNGKLYRGALLVKPAAGTDKICVINLIDLEDYLLSVLPSEMPSTWHIEALKAQAIAARSYALANLGKHAADGYDVKANTEDQVYVGVAAETQAGNLAVAQTQGIVLKYNSKVITAYFHSAAGGHTEAPENVWGGSRPFLHSVPDFDDAAPSFSWSQSVTASALEETLRKNSINVGNLLDVTVQSRSEALRVQKVSLSGSKESKVITGDQLRRMLSLPSARFNVAFDSGNYIFAGRGAGHGLGLSQWGAKTLAENGYNAAQILKYYYKDVTLEYI